MTTKPNIPAQRRPLAAVPDTAVTPFERIRHEDEQGEYWHARELQVLMGYSQWRDFYVAIDRAMESLSIVQGMEAVTSNFAETRNGERTGITGNAGLDFRLTRFACYLTAMAGDGRKEPVAGARIYFAIKTREAETAPAIETPRTFAQALRLAAAQQEEIERQEAALVEQRKILDWQAPRAQFTETFVRPDAGTAIRDFAKQVGMSERAVWSFLDGQAIVYRDGNGERRPYAQYAKHFYLVDQKSVEHRNADGTSHKTMKLTGPGKLWLATRLERVHLAPPSWDA